jgi:hypothetical protein
MSFNLNKVISKYIHETIGSVLPFVALSLPVVIGMIGLGTDAGMWMAQKRSLQNAADAAVIAATWEKAQDTEDYMDFSALKEAQNNGYEPELNGELTLNINEDDIVSVSVSQDAKLFFSRIIFRDPPRISASAQAAIKGGGSSYCILALEDEDSDAFTTFGNAEINAPNCSVGVNSESDEALSLSGNVDVTFGDVSVVGDVDIGNSVDFTYASLKTGQSAFSDPYISLEVPDFDECDYNRKRVNQNEVLNPGVYCNGLSISGNNHVTFNAGVYIINGGSLKVTGNGTLTGEDVTFIFTGSGNNYADMDISGGRDIELAPPTSGEDWSGITFFQDRNAPQNSNLQNKLTGTSDIIFNGVAYFPSQGLWFGGNTNAVGEDEPCTHLIARTITFAGNPYMGNTCDDYDVETIGTPKIELIQ